MPELEDHLPKYRNKIFRNLFGIETHFSDFLFLIDFTPAHKLHRDDSFRREFSIVLGDIDYGLVCEQFGCSLAVIDLMNEVELLSQRRGTCTRVSVHVRKSFTKSRPWYLLRLSRSPQKLVIFYRMTRSIAVYFLRNGNWIFTATYSPVWSRARWTWASEAAAMALLSNSLNIASIGRPMSSSNTILI